MKTTNGNYLKVSIYKIRVCGDNNLLSYNLKIELSKNLIETEKINKREVDLGGKVLISN